jgi:hypothetical protein
VREACWATGSGDLALGGAVPGHRRFADAVPVGARFHYCIAGVSRPEEWEVGEGELGSGNSLIRLPLASSAGMSQEPGVADAVDFGTGLKTVALTVAAAWFSSRGGAGGTIEDIAGLEDALAAKAAAAHVHAVPEVSGLAAALADKAQGVHGHALGDIAGLAETLDGKAGAVHGHGVAEVTGLSEALEGKAEAAHGHPIAAVAGLQAALDGKAALSHGHSFAALSGRPTTLGGYGITDAQPLDPDLGALAALATAAFGRSLLELPDAAALRAAAEADAYYLRPRNLGVSLAARYPLASRYFPATGCTFGTASGVAATSSALIYAQAFDIRMTLTHISFEVTVAAAAGGKVRLGIYDCLENGLPGALLQDLGETAVDGTGVKHAPLVQPFSLDRPVWFAFASNDLAWQTRWFDILASENQRSFGVSALSGGGTVAGLRGNHSFGPFPAIFPAIASTYSQCRTFAGRGSG